MNRRIFIGTAATAVTAATVASFVALGYDTHDLEVKTVPLDIGLGHPLRIAAIGDIHFDPHYEEAYIASVIARVNALRPDMIFYTGDFITAHADRVNRLSDILAYGVAPLGTFAVPGNHEHWTGIDAILGSLRERAGIRVLLNESIPLPGDDRFYLSGIDSFWSGKPDLTIFSRTPATSRHIVLVHEPDSFTIINDPRVRLQISGHTHGGQVRLPLYGAIVLPKFGREFQTGLYHGENKSLYVNRGIGTLVPHVRINCRPEITVFELT